jgi:anti-anti-sigma factor
VAVIDECRAGLSEPLDGPEETILFDLCGITFADSTGLRLLIDVKRQAQARGKRLILSCVSAPVLRLIVMTGLTSWFEYLDGHEPTSDASPSVASPSA